MRAKRTFALKVVDSDLFLSLPRSARLLYYDLGMRADDRGFILSPRRLLRSIDAPEKDLKVLLKAGYVSQRGGRHYGLACAQFCAPGPFR